MSFKVFLCIFLMAIFANAQSVLEDVVRNTEEQNLDDKIQQMEKRIQSITSNSLEDIVERTQASRDLRWLQQEKARSLLMRVIENTDISSMPSTSSGEALRRLPSRQGDTGSALLNQVADQTVKESNPALAGRDIPAGRPLVLYRDVDPSDVYMAKEVGIGGKKIVVYKSRDLRGRDVFKTLDGNLSNAIIQKRLFPKEEVILRDEQGNLMKGYPRAIYPDGTLEIKDQYGLTARRAYGAYHMTDSFKSASKSQVQTYSGQSLSPFQDLEDKKITNEEKKALEALRKAFCDL